MQLAFEKKFMSRTIVSSNNYSLGSLPDNQKICAEYNFGSSGNQHFFSQCTDNQIDEFLKSDEATCLKTLNEVKNPPVLDPDYDDVMVIQSIVEQCRLRIGDPEATVSTESHNRCRSVHCQSRRFGKEIFFSPLENTPCGDNYVGSLCTLRYLYQISLANFLS